MRSVLLFALVCGGCAGTHGNHAADGGSTSPGADASNDIVDAAGRPDDASVGGPADGSVVDLGRSCTTRITYGNRWLHPASHPDQFDVVQGDPVTWDGTCTNDGANSFATLSNGWKPYFSGHDGCVIALDGDCAPAATCTTRVTYNASWLHGPNHDAQYDDVNGRVTWDGVCHAAGGNSFGLLSNGWQPTFSGGNSCGMSLRYDYCGGLYTNAVVDVDCPDPGVIYDGTRYVMLCTSGNSPDAFPIRTSPDLVHWTWVGFAFPSGHHPAWAVSDFWAPEIHKVGGHYVLYFTARHSAGRLSVGAASSNSATGPFVDIGAPLVTTTPSSNIDIIDPNEFQGTDGTPYLLWKRDDQTAGPKQIRGQQLAPDGLSLTGAGPVTLIQNDAPWEGALVEGPWVIVHGGTYYLFYSANPFDTPQYAIGVARSSSPLSGYQKLGAPILATGGAWAGPGHCSVIDLPDGETEIVYHAWVAGQIKAGPGRVALIDRIVWQNGWPAVPGAPSSLSYPIP